MVSISKVRGYDEQGNEHNLPNMEFSDASFRSLSSCVKYYRDYVDSTYSCVITHISIDCSPEDD